MDAETMERLLIDNRLGELSPDTVQLLEAYLHVTPDADAILAEIDSVIDLADRALRADPPAAAEALPPLSIEDALRRERASQPYDRTGWARPLALAASIILAFLLGTRWTSAPSIPSPGRIDRVARSPLAAPPDGAEFWSVAKYVSDRPAAHNSNGDHVEWTSPLVWPQFGEKL